MIGKGLLIGLAYLFTYYTFGIALTKLLRMEKEGFARTMLLGLAFYNICFLIFVIPLKRNLVPLHIITRIWGVLWILPVIVLVILFRKRWMDLWRRTGEYIAGNRTGVILLLGFTAVQILFNVFYGRWSGSTDPSEYVAYVTTALFTDELGTTDPVTGIYRKVFNAKLFTQTFLDHSAVVSGLFRVHPLIEIRYVTPVIFFIMGNLAVFLLARAIFPKDKLKQWLFFAVYQFIQDLTVTAALGSGFYIYFRNYEGKDAVTALMIPIMFYVIWELYRNPKDTKTLLFGVISNIGAYYYTGTIMYLVPAACLAFVPGLFLRPYRKPLFRAMICLILPNAVYAVLYMAMTHGYLSLAI